MTRLFPLLFLIGLLAEITSIILVGNLQGLVPTLLLLMAGGVLGIALIRSAGTDIVSVLRSPVQGPSLERGEAGKAMARAGSGLLFLVPGFVSDFAGILLLLPPVRRWLGSKLPVRTFAAGSTTRKMDEIIIEAEAVEIVGDLHPPSPRTGAREAGPDKG
jgi:UPF0716 protein FxsA